MKQKWKAGILIGVAMLAIGLVVMLVVMQPWNTTELTEEKRQELLVACDPLKGGSEGLEPGRDNAIASNYEIYYYGTYNGYDVIFVEGYTFGGWYLWVGDEFFFHVQGANLYLHRSGVFTSLEDAYENRKISARNLRKVAQIHYDRKASRLVIQDIYEEYGFGDRYD